MCTHSLFAFVSDGLVMLESSTSQWNKSQRLEAWFAPNVWRSGFSTKTISSGAFVSFLVICIVGFPSPNLSLVFRHEHNIPFPHTNRYVSDSLCFLYVIIVVCMDRGTISANGIRRHIPVFLCLSLLSEFFFSLTSPLLSTLFPVSRSCPQNIRIRMIVRELFPPVSSSSSFSASLYLWPRSFYMFEQKLHPYMHVCTYIQFPILDYSRRAHNTKRNPNSHRRRLSHPLWFTLLYFSHVRVLFISPRVSIVRVGPDHNSRSSPHQQTHSQPHSQHDFPLHPFLHVSTPPGPVSKLDAVVCFSVLEFFSPSFPSRTSKWKTRRTPQRRNKSSVERKVLHFSPLCLNSSDCFVFEDRKSHLFSSFFPFILFCFLTHRSSAFPFSFRVFALLDVLGWGCSSQFLPDEWSY